VSGGEMIYNGDGLDDYINATGTYNVVNAQNSGNDSIVGGPGTNIITGSSGNSVINLSSAGSADQITLGTGFNTLNGSAGGHDSIYSTSGDQLISGNGGTDVIELGDGNNQVYAGSQTSLANAIATAFINGVLALLLPWSVLTLYGCQKNVAPGDPDYPIASDHPTQVVDLTIIDPASTKLEFNVSYAGWGGGRCTYQRAGEVSAPYSVVEPLLMTRSADVLRGQVILDKFLPGRCGWAFVGAFYKTAIGSNTTYELLRVDPSKVTPRADVYCEKDVDGSAICNSALVWSQMLKGPITKLQYDALVLSGSANPAPAYIATGTRSVLIQFHDLDAPDRGRTAISQ
jgi:hypothetical protein